MPHQPRRSPRRTEALSRERIVDTAIEVLDAAGEGGLTFRALTERLATGPGAIYWHVANKGELLGAATDAVVAAALTRERDGSSGSPPQDRVRAVALGLFDAIDAHPWIAAQLADGSWQATTPRIFESIGRQVRALGVPHAQLFTVTSVLVQYILGAAVQNAANAQVLGPDADRDHFLDAVSTAWEELDPEEYSFTRTVADQMRGHDDREQFLDGITLVLAGITAVHPAGGPDAQPARKSAGRSGGASASAVRVSSTSSSLPYTGQGWHRAAHTTATGTRCGQQGPHPSPPGPG